MTPFFITTLGCKVNQHESDAIAACLEGRGWHKTLKIRDAEVVILNTCTVTGKAASHSRQQIRRLAEHNPKALLIVTGCCAQVEGNLISAMEGVDHVIPHKDKHRIPELLEKHKNGAFPVWPSSPNAEPCQETLFMDIPAPARDTGRSRAFLKIQDGCNSFCTYCIVPYARGRSRSLNPESVLEKVKTLTKAGYKEIVLTGIHVGMYGADLNPALRFEDLLHLLLEEPSCPRLRLGSLEPMELTDNLISLLAENPKIAPHLHIPLQSGADAILKAMGRPYDSSFFAERIHAIRNKLPHAAIGTDILTGFPGETETLFKKSLKLVESLPLTYLHVFPFSPRPGTPAADFPHPVPVEISKERSSLLRKTGENKRLLFAQNLVGSTIEVIFERRRDRITGWLKGLTGNYQTLLMEGPDSLLHQIIPVTVTKIREDGRLEGQIS
ncbi:tRNA (N(6)-L-threonylcarbamoyladenosine(37)-C(2))-methylthiotransferase MtaB [Desulfobotulus mexicanus]|uniref:tRNA (N(6)-L-threonylcarbamoyladenosine(37)-C(2))-methylthiotransferase MtaB n=1 Tax=Desulfobotulus mexicanus TaxID=2586642 RepID=A0A5Q4VF23_9BACT|nr:tRNA (N(6)-L-threonylcarbamoyladenosine(37)-C(2))-methylthiotransferase MtaB [Desulfobotulus mexicanus]TYT75578.1 tRNA (N(6)-L-threonylcarbamoyladenosine(37)-C(2))-methylthiotransferase MtaB [Desulfobotulus mexicanus]